MKSKKPKEEYTTTDHDFILFKSLCDSWVHVLGLIGWKVYYEHTFCEGALGECSTHYTGQVATIQLSTSWKVKPTEDLLNETALHEVLEIFMSSLYGQAVSRYWSEDDYTKEHHRVIRTITKLLLRHRKRLY